MHTRNYYWLKQQAILCKFKNSCKFLVSRAINGIVYIISFDKLAQNKQIYLFLNESMSYKSLF